MLSRTAVRRFSATVPSLGGAAHIPLTPATSVFRPGYVKFGVATVAFFSTWYADSAYRASHDGELIFGTRFSGQLFADTETAFFAILDETAAAAHRQAVLREVPTSLLTRGGFRDHHERAANYAVPDYPFNRGQVRGGVDAAARVNTAAEVERAKTLPDSYYSTAEVVKRDERFGEGYRFKKVAREDKDAFADKFPESY